MAYDSIASIPMMASNAKDFAKKKRANRSAKLKQSKLDVRREQWLSQVKNKGGKEELNDGGPAMNANNDGERGRDRSIDKTEKLEINPRREESNGSMHQFSDSESLSNSPTSQISSNGNNFTGSSSSSSSSSSGGCCSGSITEEDDDGCLDDWEAIADALAEKEGEQNPNPNSDFPRELENASQLDSSPELTKWQASGVDKSKPKGSVSSKAWRPDDAFRPQSLPNLLKQRSFPMNSERHYGSGGTAWACKDVKSSPSSCPICFEDLDLTDSSFLPCPCGFRLCLFCHKRILEQDARCPGCRKQYEYRGVVEGGATLDGGNMTFRLARSCSMITRS